MLCLQNVANNMNPQTDLFSLIAVGAVDGVFLNFTELDPTNTGGVLHTKFILADSTGSTDCPFYRS